MSIPTVASGSERFLKLRSETPEWKSQLRVYQRDSSRFQRIHLECTEFPLTKKISHHYEATLDIDTGAVYIDCRRRRLFVKHIGLVLYAIPLALSLLCFFLYRACAEHKLSWCKRGVKFPLYVMASVALALIGIVGALLGQPNTLYYTRRWIGRVSLWSIDQGEESSRQPPDVLMPCFCPIGHLGAPVRPGYPWLAWEDVTQSHGEKFVDEQIWYFRGVTAQREASGCGRLSHYALCTPNLASDQSYSSFDEASSPLPTTVSILV